MIILMLVFNISVPAQKNLSGNLSMPATHVETIEVDRVTVDDVTGFNVAGGDTVLIIQMQGAMILTDPGSYGQLQNKYGEPGLWEFLITQSVNTGTKEIVFRNELKNIYDVKGNVQVLKVPFYNSANVTGTLTVDGWDPENKSGGVLALIIGRTLRLSADIDVTGKGFTGGKDTIGDGICRVTNETLYGKDYYPRSFTNAGFKGEGIANYTDGGSLLIPEYMKGFGPNYTGGGGGNGKYSGGGGGSNRGNGGGGGNEDSSCGASMLGGWGGYKADHPSLLNRIFMGGGGGASTKASSGGASGPGGNGGGIVIIVADSVIGNGGSISASGSAGANAAGNAGAGGGGAGGSIALSVKNYGTSPLSLYITGGKGGDRTGLIGGEGGGGGGGLLWVSTDIPGNITGVYSGGEAGVSEAPQAESGRAGEKRLDFKAALNGFLFNSIRSSITGDQIDSVCSNMLPPVITGTTPVGGIEPYTYLWEKSYDQITWIPIASGSGTSYINYTPAVVETSTVYFRRTITDNSSPLPLIDVSKPVQIIVQPFIKNNIIGTSDTICFAQDPPTFTSKATLQDGNGIYSFKWHVSIDNVNYSLPTNTYNTEDYTPPPSLETTSWYRRTVISGRCIDSSAVVKITVLDSIKNNAIVSPAEEICYGMLFSNLTATTPPALQGGDGTYQFKWEKSNNAIIWSDAEGTVNNPGYDPVEGSPAFPGAQYYRRVVYSGSNDVCVNNSSPVLLTAWPVIGNNVISDSQTICSGTIPAQLDGTAPVNGNGTYTYLWQYKTLSTPWVTAAGPNPVNQQNYLPPALTDTTWFRRVVTSSACSDTSNVIVINVHKPVLNNYIKLQSGLTDTTICNGAIPKLFKGTLPTGGTNLPGDYAYQWQTSLNETTGYSAIPGANGQDYQPGSLVNATSSPVIHYFRRIVTSGMCSDISPFIKVTVLPSITNNVITPDRDAVCYDSSPVISGTPLTGGAGGVPTWLWMQSTDGVTSWVAASGTNNQQNYTPPPMTIPLFYQRVIMSGPANCCIDTSNIVNIDINPLPTGEITTITDTTVCGGLPVPVKIHLTGASRWNLIYAENGIQISLNNILNQDTMIIINKSPAAALEIFDYTLQKVTDSNGCEATSLTGSRKITVHKVPVANAGPDEAVCGPVYTLKATPSTGTGSWTLPADVVNMTAPGPTMTVAIDSVNAPAELKKKFYWQEINWTCMNTDSVEITFYKRTGTANAGPDKDLYSFDLVDTLHALKPLVGTGSWSVTYGTAEIINDSIVINLSPGQNRFEWKIVNGVCETEDEMIINVYEIKIPGGFSPNGDGINDEFVILGLDLNYSECTLRILNSAGSEVFYTSNTGGKTWKNWNGETDSGPLPEGTYYYLLTFKSKRNNSVFRKSGFVILKRYNLQ
ncbi:MAG: gliding motility-associated C-terminal domain-containing protein [Bacteroidales bacterium]